MRWIRRCAPRAVVIVVMAQYREAVYFVRTSEFRYAKPLPGKACTHDMLPENGLTLLGKRGVGGGIA